MIVLIAPDGGRVYIPDGERHLVDGYLASGHEFVIQPEPKPEPEPEPLPERFDIDTGSMTVVQIRDWLATEPSQAEAEAISITVTSILSMKLTELLSWYHGPSS